MFPYVHDDKSIEYYTGYDTIKKRWRHLNFFEHECYLTARIPKFKIKLIIFKRTRLTEVA
jgi:hypothetical protein